MVGQGEEEHLRPARHFDRDAVRGRSRRRGSRRARDRRARLVLHVVAGAHADDPRASQALWAEASGCAPRRLAHRRHARLLDFRRPLRRHELPPVRPRAAFDRQRAGNNGHRRRRAPRGDKGAHPLHALLRRLPHLARDRQGRGDALRDARLAARPRGSRAVPRRGAEPRAPDDAQHRAEPRHLLPGARGEQRLLRRSARHRRGLHGEDKRDNGPRVPPLQLLRRARRRGNRHSDGLRQRRGRRSGRLPQRAGTQNGLRAGASLPSVLRRAPLPRDSEERPQNRRPRPLQGDGLERRAALSGYMHRLLGQRHEPRHRRRALRPLVEGHRPDADNRGVRQPRAGDPEEQLHDRHQRRRDAPFAAARPARQPRRRAPALLQVLGARRRRHRRREQKHNRHHQQLHEQIRPGLLRVRREEILRRHDIASALLRHADTLVVPRQARGFRSGAQPDLYPALRHSQRAQGGRHAAAQLPVGAGRA